RPPHPVDGQVNGTGTVRRGGLRTRPYRTRPYRTRPYTLPAPARCGAGCRPVLSHPHHQGYVPARVSAAIRTGS
ncbi:hypothetical protein, partial [Chloroflexus sp.]|uniref:hypothetical protein n=1 Tax=Chloroflexus sp. TaxID=1904827 RepID=UPI00257F89A0